MFGLLAAAAGVSLSTASLRDGLLADGTWYEGDNYHQFAHRGLWYVFAFAAARAKAAAMLSSGQGEAVAMAEGPPAG